MAYYLLINSYVLFILPILPNTYNLPKWIKLENSIFPDNQCTSIVVWNNPNTIGCTLGLPKFTNYLRDITYIPNYHLGIIVGLLLSDAGLIKQKKNPLMLD